MNETGEYRLAYAVTGYVPERTAERMGGKGQALPRHVDVQVEPGYDQVLIRVRGQDIAEMRMGATTEGATAVQLILNEGHKVETITKLGPELAGVHRFEDPLIRRLTSRVVVSSIFV